MLNSLTIKELLLKSLFPLGVVAIIVIVWLNVLIPIFLGILMLLFFGGGIYLLSRRPGNVLLIYLLGLPVYTLTLVLLYRYTGSMTLIKAFQPWKEVIAFGLLFLFGLEILHKLKIKRLYILDYLVLAYFFWNILYLITPQGPEFATRLYGLKSLAFFVIIYGLGRLVPLTPQQRKWVLWGLISIGAAAGAMAIVEKLFLSDRWLVQFGLMDYLHSFYGVSPIGHYGLTWTFETSAGLRRYSAFFANPLELASSTLITGVAAISAFFYYNPRTKGRFLAGISYGLISVSLLLAISRASLAAFFFQMIVISFLLKKIKLRLLLIFLVTVGIFFVLINPTLRAFAWQTITFQNSSSQGHLEGWIDGGRAILQQPLGLGLGTSGNTGARFGTQIGGENQFVIVGVQTGVIGLLLYAAILFLSITYSFKAFRQTFGVTKLLVFVAGVSKMGLLLPTFTSNIEIYIFAMFISWWLVGFSVQQLTMKPKNQAKSLRFGAKEQYLANSY